MFGKNITKLIFIISVAVLISPVSSSAVTESSNYKVYGGQINPVVGSVESNNYQSQIGGQPMAGELSSSNYRSQSGSVFSQETETIEDESNEGAGGTSGGTSGGTIYSGDQIPPQIISLEIVNIKHNQSIVLFDTDELTVNYIEYGIKGDFSSKTFIESSFRMGHSFVLDELLPRTEYNFVVNLRDVNYNQAQSMVYNFTTLAIDESVPGFEKIEMDDNLGDGDNEIKFTVPDEDEVDYVDIYRSPESFPSGEIEDELISRGAGNDFSDDGLVPGGTHYYTFIARDEGGNAVAIDHEPVFVPDSETIFLDQDQVDENLIPEQLFDIDFELSNRNFYSIEDLVARVNFVSFGTATTSVNLTFRILDKNNDEVHIIKGEIIIETEAAFIQEFKDINLPIGKYTLELITLYDSDASDEFYADFEITEEHQVCFFLLIRCWIWYIIVLIIILLTLFVIFKKGQKQY